MIKLANDDRRWRDWLAAVRRYDPTSPNHEDASQVAQLATALLDLAEHMATWRYTAAWSLCRRDGGLARWETACFDKVFGRAAEPGGKPGLRSLMDAMAAQDGRGGLRQPRSFAVTAFTRVALTELALPTAVSAGGATTDDETQANQRWDNDGGLQRAHNQLGPGVHPTALPAHVAATLRHCARLAALRSAVEVDSAGQAYRPQTWELLASYLERDVARGPARVRWPNGVDATDNSSCAWQARYHLKECHTDYAAPGEIPAAGAPRRAAYDQHTSRFRRAWRAAAQCGQAAVGARGGEVVGEVGRVPVAWYPPTHETLV